VRKPFVIPTGRILVAGSERAAVEAVRTALAADGSRVTTTRNADPTAVAAKMRPDLVIFAGPGPVWLDLAQRLRAQRWGARVPVLVLAGAEGPGGAGRLIDGVTDVLSFPFNEAMLRARVRAWLSRGGKFTRRRLAATKHRPTRASSASGMAVLKGLPPNERAALLAGALICRFRPGEIIFRQGDPAGGVYFLRSGRVQISIQLPDGQNLVLSVAKAGDMVGDVAALDGGTRTATAKALEATTADYIPPEMFESRLAAAPAVAMRLLRVMAGRLRKTDHLVGEFTGLTLHDEAVRRRADGRGT